MKSKACVRPIILALLACIGLGSQSAMACSCAPASLESRYERNGNVFTAVISGGEITSELVGSRPTIRNYFKVTETFKGTIPFDYLSSHTGGAACGISLEVGVEYLIFAPDTGDIGLCSGILPISSSSRGEPGIAVQSVAALRAFKSGKHASLAEPWQFFETGGVCRLAGGFPYGERKWSAAIGVTYWTRVPDGVVPSPDRPQHKAGFTEMYIWVPEREDLTDHPLKITVNDRNYSGRWEEVPHRTGRFFIDSGEVPALIAELAGASALKMMLVHPKQGELRMEASLLNAGDSVEKMLACFRKN